MYVQTKMLILVSADLIEFEGDSGIVKKWKYLFLKPDGNLMEGYDDNGVYKGDVQNVVNGYDVALAKPYPFEAKLYKGQTNWRLIAGGVKGKVEVKV